MELDLDYRLCGPSGETLESAQARARVGAQDLSLTPAAGVPLVLPWREIVRLEPLDYQVVIETSGGEALRLSSLGYRFEDFLRAAAQRRNEALIKDLLMDEPLKKSGIEAEYALGPEKGRCELRLYETALLVVPEAAGLKRVPFRDIARVERADAAVRVLLESGGELVLSQLGTRCDLFADGLGAGLSGMLGFGQKVVKELLPDLDALSLRKASAALKEGRLFTAAALSRICPGLQEGFERKLRSLPDSGRDFEVLTSLGRKGRLCWGFKKGLAGALSGDYSIYLVPFYGPDQGPRGDAVAMETVPAQAPAPGEPKAAGRATYFFRLCPRPEFAALSRPQDCDAKLEEFVALFNRCMSAVNFRRAPVFATDEMLRQPKYAPYRHAVASLPELRVLRGLFIGRVIHSEPEAWAAGVKSLLEFNASCPDEAAKWRPGSGSGAAGAPKDEGPEEG